MSRQTVIVALVGFFLLVAVIAVAGARRPTTAPAVVNLIGFTNSPSGVPVAQFQIRNQSKHRIARNGYCRLDGQVVDIPPTKTLAAGDPEVLEVPLALRSGGPAIEVRFNGVRDFSSLEAAISDVAGWLHKLGVKAGWLDTMEQRRWEVGMEFRADAPSIAPSPNAASPRQPDPDLRK